ncbi:MAG: class IV adenylate cyclase [Candidatus Bathyarchaeota archaeon]|nr:MAG: class IV adenylate cyclase [Candidatus Bathyarchaeota archaeon]
MISLITKSQNIQRTIVELKAKVDDLEEMRMKLMEDKAKYIGTFHQIDIYYEVPQGRLKLRELVGRKDAELIYYERENLAKPKKSTVFILAIPQSKAFKQILKRIVSIKAVVEKAREIFIYKGVQVHLDKVKDLGSFIELEYLTSENSEQQKKDFARLNQLRSQLGITARCLERFSYSDLITSSAKSCSCKT